MAANKESFRPELRLDYGFEPDDFVFAFCGKHVEFKKPMLMVEAAALLRAEGRRVVLLFGGAGQLTAQLKGRAAELGVPAYFTGFVNQSELWKVYLPADAFVLPSSNRETWGLVTNEAMLFGLPVLVSESVGCCEDLVHDGVTGYRFTSDVHGLASAMCKLLSCKKHARGMGAAGRELVLGRYSMHSATNGLLSAVDQLERRSRKSRDLHKNHPD